MCVVEKKIYLLADGNRRTVETVHRCSRATAYALCADVEDRTIEQANVVERRPAMSPRAADDDDNLIRTQGRDGRGQVYRDIGRRASKRTSAGNSNATSSRSSASSPAGSSLPSKPFARPRAPTPPPTGVTMPSARRAAFATADPLWSIQTDGTAVYGRPPSLELPRAEDNERRTPLTASRPGQSSSSATTSGRNVNSSSSSERRPRRPSIIVDTSNRHSAMSSASPPVSSSPGLSQIPKLSTGPRHDSAANFSPPRYQTTTIRPHAADRTVPIRDRYTRDASPDRRSQATRSSAEDARQAQLERNRLVDAERRQQVRRTAELDAAARAERTREELSRERHRLAAAAALEGQGPPPIRPSQLPVRTSELSRRLEAERQQMAREREQAQPPSPPLQPQTMRITTTTQYRYDDPPVGSTRTSSRTSRSPDVGNDINAHGQAVLARARARTAAEQRTQRSQQASQRLTDVLNAGSAGREVEDEEDEEPVVEYADERRDERRARREGRREEKRRQFWD